MKIDQNDLSVSTDTATETVATKIYHHTLNVPKSDSQEINSKTNSETIPQASEGTQYVWEHSHANPFDELIISWNAMRPQYGGFAINVSIKLENWTPWFPYAYWGDKGQWGGDISSRENFVEIKHDILSVTEGVKASGFKIQARAVDGANLDDFYTLHACATSIKDLSEKKEFISGHSIDLKVPLVSQMTLPHVRKRDMCSPASTSAAISYLLKKNRLDPIAFALQAHDDVFDIFGNWVLNTAHAASVMGKDWECWVQRLQGFGDIYKSLQDGMPVVVSLKDELPGSSFTYTQGHLVVVKGYRVSDNRVLCMDPAFPDDQATDVSYQLDHFMEAWSKRQFVAYVFKR